MPSIQEVTCMGTKGDAGNKKTGKSYEHNTGKGHDDSKDRWHEASICPRPTSRVSKQSRDSVKRIPWSRMTGWVNEVFGRNKI